MIVVGLKTDGGFVRKKIEDCLPNNVFQIRRAERAPVGEVVEFVSAAEILYVNGVEQIVDDVAQKVALLREFPFPLRALQGVTNGPHEQMAIDMAFYKKILRPALDGPHRQRLVVKAAEHDHRRLRHEAVDALEGFHPFAVGQRQIADQ